MSTADELSASAPKDTAYTIPEALQQWCADNAGGDSGNATPAAATTGPLAVTAVPSAGDSDVTWVDKQCRGDTPEALYSASTSLAPTSDDRREDVGRNGSGQQPNVGPVVHVRERYPPAEYRPYESRYRRGRGGGGGTWGGGGGGGRGHRLRLLDDGEWEEAGAFSEATVRRAFIRKVYTVLSVQLAFTSCIVTIFSFEPNVRQFVVTHRSIRSTAWMLFLATYLTLWCCGNVRKRSPWNVILLSIFTLSLSYMLGVTAAYFGPYIVLMAVSMTTIIVLFVTLVATFSKVDITGCAALLCVLFLGAFVFALGVTVVFFVSGARNLLMLAVIPGLFCIFFSVFLMYDTQLIMGGRDVELLPDEYIFAAMKLYLDIAYIFRSLMWMLYCCYRE